MSVQAANGTNTSSDRASIQAEVTALSQEITRIACRTSFGGKKVLSAYGTSESIITSASISGGKVTGKINFQVGSNHDDLQTLDMNIYENNRSGTVTKKTAGTAAATTGTTTPLPHRPMPPAKPKLSSMPRQMRQRPLMTASKTLVMSKTLTGRMSILVVTPKTKERLTTSQSSALTSKRTAATLVSARLNPFPR